MLFWTKKAKYFECDPNVSFVSLLEYNVREKTFFIRVFTLWLETDIPVVRIPIQIKTIEQKSILGSAQNKRQAYTYIEIPSYAGPLRLLFVDRWTQTENSYIKSARIELENRMTRITDICLTVNSLHLLTESKANSSEKYNSLKVLRAQNFKALQILILSNRLVETWEDVLFCWLHLYRNFVIIPKESPKRS